ncbi:NDR1/HIN1-like protein 10 [Silene latifolia]|uniref:NDR1/HIN1-like protein 10 n=1 Tax=Silene latifolia TaxID=37657 RepID=UPI003D78127F
MSSYPPPNRRLGQIYPEQNGPSTPPPPQPRHVTLYVVLWSFLITVVIVGGVIIPVVRHIVRKDKFQFYATNATLSTFNFTNNILNFNLAVSLTAFNPDPRISIYDDDALVDAIYQGQRFKTIQAAVYHKQQSEPGLVFKGQKIVVLGSCDKSEFDKQSNQGVYEIQVKLHLEAGFKVGSYKIGFWKATVDCHLNLPLAAMLLLLNAVPGLLTNQKVPSMVYESFGVIDVLH